MATVSRSTIRALPAGVASAALLALLVSAAPARAEYPGLAREFTTENFSRTPHGLQLLGARRHFAVGVAVGEYLRGLGGGTWNPANQTGSLWGARVDALLRYKRFTLGGDAVNDGTLNAAAPEYPQRLYGAVHVPEAFVAMTGSAGFDAGRYQGVDVSAEAAPLQRRLNLKDLDLAPRLWFWMRYRKLNHETHPIVTPAAAIELQHFPVFGSQPAVALSLHADLADQRLPATYGLLQIGFDSVPRPLRGGSADPNAPPEPGAGPPSRADRNWFATLGYAFPFDQRSSARFIVQVGLRSVCPYGGN